MLAHRLAQARDGDSAAAVDALRAVLCLESPLSQQGRYGELIAAPAPVAVWTVSREARWFTPPQSLAVSLGRRGAVRRILDALVDRRLAAPGTTLTAHALVALGWPGEKIQHEAGLRRARMAIVELRGLGLRDLLLTRDDGYLLDPSVPLVRSDHDRP